MEAHEFSTPLDAEGGGAAFAGLTVLQVPGPGHASWGADSGKVTVRDAREGSVPAARERSSPIPAVPSSSP